MKRWIRKMQAENNKCVLSPIWIGTDIEISEYLKALQNMEPDSAEEIKEKVIVELKRQIPEVRNIFANEKKTQQKRAEHGAHNEISDQFSLSSIGLDENSTDMRSSCRCPPNSHISSREGIWNNTFVCKAQVRYLAKKILLKARARKIMYYIGSAEDQSTDYLREEPGYRPFLPDSDTALRKLDLVQGIADFNAMPNLSQIVFRREIGLRFPGLRAQQNAESAM